MKLKPPQIKIISYFATPLIKAERCSYCNYFNYCFRKSKFSKQIYFPVIDQYIVPKVLERVIYFEKNLITIIYWMKGYMKFI